MTWSIWGGADEKGFWVKWRGPDGYTHEIPGIPDFETAMQIKAEQEKRLRTAIEVTMEGMQRTMERGTDYCLPPFEVVGHSEEPK